MDVEALTTLRERLDEEWLAKSRSSFECPECGLQANFIAEIRDAFTALSAGLSHWEVRAKELERERNSYDDACVRAVYRAEAAEARAKELERHLTDIASSDDIDNALDPERNKRVARAALEGKDNG